jgi:hypothetical protein
MKDKETLIRETMDSLDGILRASPEPGFYERLRTSPGCLSRDAKPLKWGVIWQVAAGLALLVSLNIAIIAYYYQSGSSVSTVPTTEAQEYLAYLETINL